MNFSQAFLWTALIVMIGIFVLIFYLLIKDLVDDKKEPDNKDEKPKGRKPAPALPSGRNTRAEIYQGHNSTAYQISGNSGKVEVNITNSSPDPASTKDQGPDNSRLLASLTDTPAETEKRSTPRKNRKGRQE